MVDDGGFGCCGVVVVWLSRTARNDLATRYAHTKAHIYHADYYIMPSGYAKWFVYMLSCRPVRCLRRSRNDDVFAHETMCVNTE